MQSVSAEGLARTGAGEEPRAVVGSEGGAAGASGGKLAYELAQRFGQFDGGSAQLQRGDPVALGQVAELQASDTGDGLAIEDEEQPGDPVRQRNRPVGHEPSR